MTGETTAPAPISDLLAAIESIPRFAPVGLAQRDLIVRGVRDLAARVETLEQENAMLESSRNLTMRLARDVQDRVETLTALLEKHGGHAPGCFREKLFGADGCICGWDQVRADLTDVALTRIAGQSTTEQPMTLDQLREKAENAKTKHEEWFIAAYNQQDFNAAWTPEVALAFVEYVQANEAWVASGDGWAEAKAAQEASERLFSLLGEQP